MEASFMRQSAIERFACNENGKEKEMQEVGEGRERKEEWGEGGGGWMGGCGMGRVRGV
jgi:hypothetical protein